MGQVSTVDDVGYTVSAVARRLGISASTLRTWERRYGLAPSLRTIGSHRRYTAEDLAVLESMHGLMLSGMPPGDAARAVQNGLSADTLPPQPPHPASAAVPPLRRASVLQRSLDRAASTMDSVAAADVIRRSIEQNGVTWAWDEVVAPVMRSIGERYTDTPDEESGIDIEHHLSHLVIRELAGFSDVRLPRNVRPILLASAPDDQHSLPLYALAAALAERGIETRMLGARTPASALAAAVRRTGPQAVFIWAHARPAVNPLASVPAIRPSAAVFVGGPGWAELDVSSAAGYPKTLLEAVTQVSGAVLAGGG